jgi:hypothetical protein
VLLERLFTGDSLGNGLLGFFERLHQYSAIEVIGLLRDRGSWDLPCKRLHTLPLGRQSPQNGLFSPATAAGGLLPAICQLHQTQRA